MKLGPYVTDRTQFKMDLGIETVRLPKYHIGEKNLDIGPGSSLSALISKVQAQKQKQKAMAHQPEACAVKGIASAQKQQVANRTLVSPKLSSSVADTVLL